MSFLGSIATVGLTGAVNRGRVFFLQAVERLGVGLDNLAGLGNGLERLEMILTPL